jgi:hypothetical protein
MKRESYLSLNGWWNFCVTLEREKRVLQRGTWRKKIIFFERNFVEK